MLNDAHYPTPRLAVLPEVGPEIGAGHIARTLALAQAWNDLRGAAVCAAANLPSYWSRQYESAGIDYISKGQFRRETPDWLALDGYGLPDLAPVQGADAPMKILSIDDFGMSGRKRYNLALDQNIPSPSRTATEGDGGAPRLLGPRYALLRRDIRKAAAAFFRSSTDFDNPSEDGNRLLVSAGGSPTSATMHFLRQALSTLTVGETLKPYLLEGTEDMSRVLPTSRIAITSAGSTCWELCLFGIPMIVFSIAENQARLGRQLARAGVAIYTGDLSATTSDALASAIQDLAKDKDRRAAMSRAARNLVDGWGAFRVATAMRAQNVRLRPAQLGDAQVLYELAMNEEVRRWSFNPEPFTFSEHLHWLSARLTSPSCRIYVISDAVGRSVGYVRFEERADYGGAEIGVALSPAVRRLGLAGPAVSASVDRYAAEGGSHTILARIKPGNDRSIRAFLNADFDRATSANAGLDDRALVLTKSAANGRRSDI